jgi:hypothetical protein
MKWADDQIIRNLRNKIKSRISLMKLKKKRQIVSCDLN